ncbi:hypothetical protein FHR92_002422 [Fontibacillus solani]|uniref:Uncharacterized protein n=1 Tax=Fontibacillus solani TaxID=1572857 RepID=A0A7W3STG2_9BACL|nr:hypothetical protein [Fontibacillus solani]MBA9085950.1 hypothetical protein [Fontibacillus solani]
MVYSWYMNLVVLLEVLRNGLEYPLFYSVWRKLEDGEEGNWHDAPAEALRTYGKRWCIGVSVSESHQHAHMELLFATESYLLMRYGSLTKKKRAMMKAAPTAKWFVASSTLVVRSAGTPIKASSESTLILT